MTDQLINKLKNLKADPPRAAWELISQTLDKEYDSREIVLSKKLLEIQLDPPANCREEIFSRLNDPDMAVNSGKLIRMRITRIAAAAIIVGIVSLSAFYLFNKNLPTAVNEHTAVVPLSGTAAVDPLNADDPLSDQSSDQNIVNNFTEKNTSGSTTKKESGRQESQPIQYAELYSTDDAEALSYSPIDKGDFLIKHADKIVVNAPPIKDDNGKIIMDMNLVSSDNHKYVVVTSPNGKQTRISKKFADKLSCLNTEFAPVDFSIDAFEWKFRFQEWRNLLLQHENFIPMAGNFLDILELKNLIDDK